MKTKFITFFLIICLPVLSVAQSSFGSLLAESSVDLPYLSPRPVHVKGVETPVLSLNGDWRVSVQGSKFHSIIVPGELIMQGIDLNIGETAVYRKEVHLPETWGGNRKFIRFDGVSSHALVKVNGKEIGEHEGSFAPFQMEITEALSIGMNTIEVEVRANTISDVLGCTSQYAAHTVAGIIRKVTIFALPMTYVQDFTVNTLFDVQFEHADLEIESNITGIRNDAQSYALRYTLKDDVGKSVKQVFTSITNGAKETTVTSKVVMPVKSPKHWNPEHPYLYTLVTELLNNDTIIQENHQKIGFREVEVKKSQVLVNGRPIKLHGVNRHSVHPLLGRSLTPELDQLDAKLFKQANCNFIRTSHYPPSEEFLQAADSIGLFVESEASLTWIQHNASPIWELWNYQDPKYLPYLLRANLDNVQANKSHPSIIIWSLANESRWSPLWEKVMDVVSDLDPTRPTSFHDQCWGGFNNAGSTADIANYHYPAINGPAATDTMSRPVLFGEYAHLPTYNRRELLTDPGIRDAYNKLLVTFYDSIYSHPRCLGGAIWSGIDDIFHLPNGKIVGYGPWGPLDGWRREKPEYFGIKKAYSPIRILNVDRSSDKITLVVENRYDFTDFADLKIKALVNGDVVQVTGQIPPRSQGILKIPIEGEAKNLHVIFYDPNGFVADEITCTFEEFVPGRNRDTVAVSYIQNDDSFLIRQGELEFRISKRNGKIVSVRKNGEPILYEGPSFVLVEANSEYGGKNNIAGATYQRVIHPLQAFPWYYKYASNISISEEGDAIKVIAEITFKEGTGTMIYSFATDGSTSIEYEIKTTGNLSPYQYGLVMQLPKSFDQLKWKRQGDFSVYPETHIGRPEGSAKLHARQTDGVAPWRVKPEHPWKDDANELGSNDFRSTKRNIYHVSLSDDKGNKMIAESHGNQASRTWLQEGNIHWLIADYWNNGSEPFYGSPHSDGRINTKDKILKEKLLLFIE